jgi:hypothetical protein
LAERIPRAARPVEERRAFEERVRAHVRRVWQQIENDFAPQTRKYV